MNLVWLRNDLRLDDNPALHHACQQGLSVRALYIATPGQWRTHDEAPLKLGFRGAALNTLVKRLAKRGIGFDLLQVNDFKAIPELLSHYCQRQGIRHLFFNQEIPLNEQLRDQAVTKALEKLNITIHAFNADLLVTTPLRNQQGKTYRVFTPWYRAWLRALEVCHSSPLREPLPVGNALSDPLQPLQLPGSESFREDLWPATEQEALRRLAAFTRHKLGDYDRQRDFPAINGTSTLSPYLASGLISPRRCVMAIQQAAYEQGWNWQESVWLRELGWREFYRYLLLHFPHLNKGQPFKQSPQAWPWQHNPAALSAWQSGHTGFPIIDAAMRQLLKTGWMHNRLRMLTASFLCKLLLIDWHEGERFFMQHLIDGDFASNNGGWQWSAATGCDAAPWFRIFRPDAQSQKFDPNGDFIRRFLPELGQLDSKHRHNPTKAERIAAGYPLPIIDYNDARQRALESFTI